MTIALIVLGSLMVGFVLGVFLRELMQAARNADREAERGDW